MGKILITIKNDKLYSIDGYDTEVKIIDDNETHLMHFRNQKEIYERGKADKYFRDSAFQDIETSRKWLSQYKIYII